MSEANNLFRGVQTLLAGHTEAAVMQALLQSLVAAIGVSAVDLDRARAIINALPMELTPMLEQGWLNYRAHRAKAAISQNAGTQQ
jgi:hypothetical protein